MAVRIATLVARAVVEFGIDRDDETLVAPYSPARATTAIAKRYAYPRTRLVPLVAEVYYEGNGRANPLPASAAKGPKSLAKAVRKRRDAGGRLARWEVVAYSASETLGRPVSVAAIRALYRAAGGDETRSYTGNGTRKGAPATRADETAELANSLGSDAGAEEWE